MQIEFSKKQFEQLLKLVYLGGWMVNAHRTDDRIDEYDKLEEYIFSFASKFGLEKYVDSSETLEGRTHFPTAYFEDETDIHEFQEEYDDNTFWEEIIDRFAWRDFERLYGKEAIRAMSADDRMHKISEFESKYVDEINEHGIGRFEIEE